MHTFSEEEPLGTEIHQA